MHVTRHSPHIVVIDHTPEIRLLFEELLASESYRATVLGACPETPERVAALRPDVIVHDYTPLHAEADLRSLRWLTTDPRTRHIPLVVCSAALDASEIVEGLGSARVRVVRKPFTLDDVLDALRDCSAQRLPAHAMDEPRAGWHSPA